MIRPLFLVFLMVAAASLTGCRDDSAAITTQPVGGVQPAPCHLSISLDSMDYRGGESDKHWHLTRWSLRNDSDEPIAEAIVRVTLFDHDATFLGHFGVTFQHVLPGETARQRRLLLLKSDNISQWRPRCESVTSRNRGDLTSEFHVKMAVADKQS